MLGLMAKFLGGKTAKKQKRGAGREGTLLLLGSHEAKHQVWAVLTQRGRVCTARTSASPILYSLLKDLTKFGRKPVPVAAWVIIFRVQPSRAQGRREMDREWTGNGNVNENRQRVYSLGTISG